MWALSDIHIDFHENWEFIQGLSNVSFQNDVLLVAGDATDRCERLQQALGVLKQKFAEVAFVPGNHELWLRKGDDFRHSVEKFYHILSLCKRIGVRTDPFRHGSDQYAVWIVPLFSWYAGPDQAEHSLFLEKPDVDDKTDTLWSDFFLTRWPEDLNSGPAEFFARLNHERTMRTYDAPVISFSHFLPRQELMLSTQAERARSELVYKDIHPEFNFSRVAGSTLIDQQLRTINSQVHVYGHQHRNRNRLVDGVRYLSHCLGYPKERQARVLPSLDQYPIEIWNTEEGFVL